MAPNDDARPSYRTCLLAEDDRTKAMLLAARYMRVDEIAYVLGVFPDVLEQTPSLETGWSDAPLSIKRLPRPSDPIALANLIGDATTGQVVDAVEDGKDAGASATEHKGRAAGARNLTPGQWEDIARVVAETRWRKFLETSSPSPDASRISISGV